MPISSPLHRAPCNLLPPASTRRLSRASGRNQHGGGCCSQHLVVPVKQSPSGVAAGLVWGAGWQMKFPPDSSCVSGEPLAPLYVVRVSAGGPLHVTLCFPPTPDASHRHVGRSVHQMPQLTSFPGMGRSSSRQSREVTSVLQKDRFWRIIMMMMMMYEWVCRCRCFQIIHTCVRVFDYVVIFQNLIIEIKKECVPIVS